MLPAYFTEELIELIVGERRICRHLHVPLQSGSDRVLRAMRRPYTARMYRTLVERLGGAIPGLGLGADVIAGFPGETDADFEATAALVEALPFSYLHVFSYSDRRGTEAARGIGLPDRARDDPAAHSPAPDPRRGQAAGVPPGPDRPGAAGARARAPRARGRTAGRSLRQLPELAFAGPEALMRRLVRVRATGQDGARLEGVLVSDG